MKKYPLAVNRNSFRKEIALWIYFLAKVARISRISSARLEKFPER
jgi:hypothetical protein